MAANAGGEFEAVGRAYWTIDGTDMNLVTDANLTPVRARKT